MKQQSGFTLIELIMVIVILGILAATALPKFVDISKDARIAALSGIEGAAKSAATMVYGKALVAGVAANATASISSNGATVTLAYGYPDSNATTGIFSVMQDNGGATLSGGNLWTLQTNCTLTYASSVAANTPPVLTTVTTGC